MTNTERTVALVDGRPAAVHGGLGRQHVVGLRDLEVGVTDQGVGDGVPLGLLDARELRPRAGDAPGLQGYLVRGLSPSRVRASGARRPLSEFVGRAQELGALRELLAKAVAGSGQAVGIAGDPGSGKSRLLTSFAARCGASGSPTWRATAWRTRA
jgi:hypothetical protein